VLADSPQAYWRFGETSGSTAADASGNGHTAGLYGVFRVGDRVARKLLPSGGGDIGVHSEPGRGTTFKVYLPRVQKPVDQLEETVADDEPPGGVETILIAEDEEFVRSFEREVLTERGYTVLVARGPAHALELARDHSGVIHLLVADVVMPELSGLELAEQLARDRPEMKTLYTSGYAPGAIVNHGVIDAGVAFLAKPLSRLALAQKVREVLDAPDGS